MQKISASPMAMFSVLWQHRKLIHALSKREVASRYRGSYLGICWAVLTPAFMLAVYTFVFSVVFNAKWGDSGHSKTEFALILFTGLVVFSVFSECISRAPGLVVANASYVKKVIFPLEILALVTLVGALFNLLVSLLVWMLFYLVCFGLPPLTGLLLPLVLLPLVLFVLGLSWLLASLGVFLRDVGQMVGVLVTALMFMSPIFYPLSAIPEDYRYLLELNPLTHVIEQARAVLLWGQLPAFGNWALSLGAGFICAWGGFAWFQKTRKGFADVL
ncbi:ABC transporter permease [Pseudomonas farsensis]